MSESAKCALARCADSLPGAAGLARDVRLACHGLDSADNEFIIGLVGEA